MTGKEKLYFLLNRIDDARAIAPSGRPITLHLANDLNNTLTRIELAQLLEKLQLDEKVLKVVKIPNEVLKDEYLDPYSEVDEGCYYIRILPTFDAYFLKIQQEPEYQELTGKKPATSPTKPDGNALMTYEEKLDLIVKAVVGARKATRNGKPTMLYLNATNGLDCLDREEIRNILLQLQDKNALKINPKTNRLLPLSEQPSNPGFFLLDILENFDDWYNNYLIVEKSKLENLSKDNFDNIFNVLCTIENELQINQSGKIVINFISSFNELEGYEKTDIDDLVSYYVRALTYLKNMGVIKEFTTWENNLYSEITVNIGKFNEILERAKKIKQITKKLPRETIQEEQEKTSYDITNDPQKGIPDTESKTVWPEDFRWEGNNFVFGQYGSIAFTSRDRRFIFKTLTDKKGGWATVSELKSNKDAGYVRSTIKQIEDRLPKKAKAHMAIISTQDDDSEEKPREGAYRIKILP